jgi:uncharacterized membrane protein (DUF4010 family)
VPALKWGVVLSARAGRLGGRAAALRRSGPVRHGGGLGLADVDAVTLAVSRQSHDGTLPTAVASLAITIAVVANTLVKGTMAVVMGRKGFGRPIALVFAAAIAVGVGTAVALRMQ